MSNLDPQHYRLIVIKHAIQVYLLTGRKVNTLYTPTNMREAVSRVTGKEYPRSRRGLLQAYTDLKDLLS